jgi:SAM-dependent methyltransferase
MLKWFRQGGSVHQTAMAMIGPKAGDRLLVAGQADAGLVAELARVTGLNGQTTVACSSAVRQSVEAAASKAGALVDVLELGPADHSPVPPGVTELDIVVLALDLGAMGMDARLDAARDAIRVLRPGGRLLLVDTPRRTGLLAARTVAGMAPDAVVPMLTTVGAMAARALGAADHITYYEARKAR